MAVGIGKSYAMSKFVKGNIQTLYHYTWSAYDPYRPLIEIRIGFTFSLKRVPRPEWKQKLKELTKEVSYKNHLPRQSVSKQIPTSYVIADEPIPCKWRWIMFDWHSDIAQNDL